MARVGWLLAGAVIGLTALESHAQDPRSDRQVRVRISGVLVDSTEMRPVAGATVQLVGRSEGTRSRSVVTAPNGAYAFDSVNAGRYLLGFLAPSLEDFGVDPPLAVVDVREPGEIVVPLAVPSAHTVITKVCGVTDVADSLGLLLGTVRSSRDGSPVPRATVRVEWSEIMMDKQGTRHSHPAISIQANADGAFTLCHVPMGTGTRVRAWAGPDSSGFADITIPIHGLASRDLFLGAAVARRMPLTNSAASRDTAHFITVARGTSTLAGTIRRSEGEPLPGARVMVWGTGIEAITTSNGSFRLDSLPSGTWTFEARALGFMPQRRTVDLMSSEPNSVSLSLDAITTTLDTLKVLSSRIYTATEVAGFERRKHMGMGVMLDESDLERFGVSMYASDVFRRIIGVTVAPSGPTRFGYNVRMRAMNGMLCTPSIYIDGAMIRPDAGNLDELVDPANIRYLEVYANSAMVPAEFKQMKDCGSIVITTKQRPVR